MAFNLNNPWVGYLQRSYEQIKVSLINRLVVSNPEITDHSESNILIVIIGMFAGLIEHLNYYVDNMAREAFIDTARFFSSMVRLVRMLDYRIKAKIPASVTLTISLEDGSGNLQAATGPAFIPAGTVISTSDGVQFRLTSDVNIAIGDTQVTVGASQYTLIASTSLGNTTGASNEVFIIGTNYVHQSIAITINGDIWSEQTTLGLSGPTDRHFIVDIDVDGNAFVQFGDGTFGMIPPTPYAVLASWRNSLGASGNLISEGTITSWASPPTVPGVTAVLISNVLKPSGGSNYEGVESMRFRAPLSLRTLDRAVTPQDYEDIALLAPGVAKAKVKFCCNDGSCIKVYIGPNGGGIAQIPLLNSTYAFICGRKMVLDPICVLPAGITPVPVTVEVNARVGVDPVPLQTDVLNQLNTYFGYDSNNINRGIFESDIYRRVDELYNVENLNILIITTRPYARPYNHINELTWIRIVTQNSDSTLDWKIQYQGSNMFGVWKNAVWQGHATIGVPFTDADNIIEFTVQLGVYAVGNTWDFRTYPYGENQLITDFSVPVIEPTVIINPSSSNQCNSNC